MVESRHISLRKFIIIGKRAFPSFRKKITTSTAGGIAHGRAHPVLDVVRNKNKAILQCRTYVECGICLLGFQAPSAYLHGFNQEE